MAEWQSAPISPSLRATLALLEKVTLAPDEVSPSDIQGARRAGVSRQGVTDALYVCFCFNWIDRLADAFDWRVQSSPQFRKDAGFLLKKGYALVAPVRWRAALHAPPVRTRRGR